MGFFKFKIFTIYIIKFKKFLKFNFQNYTNLIKILNSFQCLPKTNPKRIASSVLMARK